MSSGGRATRESRYLVQHAFQLARELKLQKMLILAHEELDLEQLAALRESEQIVWLVATPPDDEDEAAPGGDFTPPKGDATVELPLLLSTERSSQLKTALFFTALAEHIEPNETVLYLSGIPGAGRLDTLVVTNPRRDIASFKRLKLKELREYVVTRELGRLLQIALRLAAEGREGRAIGTLFVLGDPEELEPHINQLILNPVEGHARRYRNIHNSEFLETLRELSALDGGFLVSNGGVVESAGTYFEASTRKASLRPGLGARHAAGKAITIETHAVAVVVSQSSSTVTVFHEGHAVLEFGKAE
jgi:diadenylate cyclase